MISGVNHTLFWRKEEPLLFSSYYARLVRPNDPALMILLSLPRTRSNDPANDPAV